MYSCSLNSILVTLAITTFLLLSLLLLNYSLSVQKEEAIPLLRQLKTPESIDEQTVEDCL